VLVLKLALHQHLAILVNLIFVLDILLHAVDSIFFVHLALILLLVITFLIFLYLLHELLLLELFSECRLLFRVHVGDVFLVEVVIDVLSVHFLVLSFLLHTLVLHLHIFFLLLGPLHHLFLIVFISLVFFHNLIAFISLHCVELLLLLQVLVELFLTTFTIESFLILVSAFCLPKSISAVLTWEVGSGKVETIVVFGRNEEFLLFVGERSIWVQAIFSQNCDKLLELFDLAQIVDESLGNLLDKQRSIGNLELNLRLDVLVLLIQRGHALACHRLRSNTLLLERV